MSLLAANPDRALGGVAGKISEGLVSFTVQPLPGENISELCRRLAVQLNRHGAAPLQLLAFGDCRASAAVTDELKKFVGPVDWPITWAEGAGCAGEPVAGLQVHGFTGEIERMIFEGQFVGAIFTDGGARQCIVGGLGAENPSGRRPEQTRRALENLQGILAEAGFELADVVRTWFFLDDILAWYDDFNRARAGIYSGVKFRTGSLPASTGIGARNPARSALALAAWAFQPREKNSYAEEVASPLQCPAPAYGSSFSRAMEISTGGGRQLFISGTASIAPGGETLWVGDSRKQVDATMEVVEAILRARGFALGDLSRATAYFKNPADAPIFDGWLAERNLSALPIVSAGCAVCRDNLLFELEAEAVTSRVAAKPGAR